MKNSNRKISLLIVAHVCMYHMFIIVRVSCGCVAVFRQIKIVSVCIRKSPLTLLQSHNNNTYVTHMREYAVFEDARAHRHNRRSCRRCRHWPRWSFTFFLCFVWFVPCAHRRVVVDGRRRLVVSEWEIKKNPQMLKICLSNSLRYSIFPHFYCGCLDRSTLQQKQKKKKQKTQMNAKAFGIYV